jgi:hypothetical protein
MTVFHVALVASILFAALAFVNGARSERYLTQRHYAPLQSFRYQITCILWAALAVATSVAGILCDSPVNELQLF